MEYFFRNLHIFVFVLVSVLSAVWVASDPRRTASMIRPLVEDAVELQELAQGAYSDIRQLRLRTAAGEAVSLYVASLRMPSMLFEKLADKLEKIDRQVKHGRRVDVLRGSGTGHAVTLMPDSQTGPRRPFGAGSTSSS
jgi:hypothetical protein